MEVAIAFTPRDDARLLIQSVDLDERVEVELTGLAPGAVSGWAAYPAGVAWALAQAGSTVRGLTAAVAGNLPTGAGLSSSAAIEVAFALALREVSGLDVAGLELARICQNAENGFVGVQCGIMDQATSACGRLDSALLLDCRSLEIRHVPLPPGLNIVVVDSGVSRQLRSSGYNTRRRECEDALARLRAVDDDIDTLRDIDPESLHIVLRHLPPPLDRRVAHVVGEIERVRLAAAALEHGETERFGELMFASHRSSRDQYEVSIDELDALVELAAAAPGIVGARLTGAGFGGCTVNVVSSVMVEEFIEAVAVGFEKRFGRRPRAWISGAGAGATVTRGR